MQTGNGQVAALILRDGFRHARISCPANLIPAPGQYLLAADVSDANLSLSKGSPLPDPIFYTDSAPEGFLASRAPDHWMPGMQLYLRGPLGRGFEIPAPARKIAVIPFRGPASRLFPLIRPALRQGAAVVLVSDLRVDELPDEVEVQPESAVGEILTWADWVALDARREDLHALREWLGNENPTPVLREAAVLLGSPVPCGGIAECGVCAVTTKNGWKMACKDGPVFRWGEISVPNSK